MLERKVRSHRIIQSISSLVLCVRYTQFYVSYRYGLSDRQIENCREVDRLTRMQWAGSKGRPELSRSCAAGLHALCSVMSIVLALAICCPHSQEG